MNEKGELRLDRFWFGFVGDPCSLVSEARPIYRETLRNPRAWGRARLD